MVPSYRQHALGLLQLLSQGPSSAAFLSVQDFIGRINEPNRSENDDSSEERIHIEGVTGETFSALVATALNDIATLKRFSLELWATPLYNAVEQHLQGEVVAEQELANENDNEEDNESMSTLSARTATTAAASSSATTTRSTDSAAASTSATTLQNEGRGSDCV